jgi:hypothetical protein
MKNIQYHDISLIKRYLFGEPRRGLGLRSAARVPMLPKAKSRPLSADKPE